MFFLHICGGFLKHLNSLLEKIFPGLRFTQITNALRMLSTRSSQGLRKVMACKRRFIIVYLSGREVLFSHVHKKTTINVGSVRDTKPRSFSSEGLNEDLVLYGSVLSPRIYSSEYEDLCMCFLRGA